VILTEKPALDIEQILVSNAGFAGAHPLDAGIGAEAIKAKQQPMLKGFLVEVLPTLLIRG
jgi:hypothetical protein